MKNTLYNPNNKKEASSLLFFVFFFMAFLMFMAFAVDGTIVLTNRVKLQSATEASALAAAASQRKSAARAGFPATAAAP